MHKPILEFNDDYYWLSNFYESEEPFKMHGLKFNSGEVAFQYAKIIYLKDPSHNLKFYEPEFVLGTTPNQAKQVGRRMPIDIDSWEENKDEVMRTVIWCKFTQNEELLDKLLATGHSMLIEGNWWGDTYWGKCGGQGSNVLGVMLMELRAILRYNIGKS